ncbi:MAG: flagellar hook-associated protein 3 [Erysipelotrichia bacterium]|nr:flagellar hook-associated protein 3 [Erysipelotrichia bacterium]
MRITNQWVISSFVNQVNRVSSDLSDMQIKISSGKKYIRASESPINNALSMQGNTEVAENTQYMRNVDHVSDWYNNIDTSLTSIESVIQRVRELAVEGANDTLVQEDRDSIAKEIDELMLHLVDIGNTTVNGESIFAGHDVDNRPFAVINGNTPGYNNNMVTYSLGDVRNKVNLTSPVDISYSGDNKRLTSEIERGTIIEKSVSGLELFFGGQSISPTPGFTYEVPPLEKSMPLSALNSGNGVQSGLIIITDQNNVEHKIDLTTAHRLDDIIGIINNSGSFEAGIEEVPSDTAVSLGINRNAGYSSLLVGLSDPKMLSEFTNLSDLNNGLGVAGGYLSINTRDGENHRIDISGATTVADVLASINAVDGGAALNARYDMIHKRLEIEDLTGGTGQFSVTSTRTQLYIKDTESQVADDLGLLRNVGTVGNQIFSTLDSAMESEQSPLSLLNGGQGVERGLIDITGHDGVTSRIDLTNALTVQDVIDSVNAQAGGRQTASFDSTSKRILITDNTAGTEDFEITEASGTSPIRIREVSTVTANLGLLKSTNGNTLVGDSLVPAGLTEASLLSGLVPPPEKGFMVVRGADDAAVKIDLTAATTIKDVLDGINATGKFSAVWEVPENRFVVADTSAGDGFYGLKIEEETNTGRDLGLIIGASNHVSNTITSAPIQVQSLPTLVGSVDLNPSLTLDTDLQSLNSSRTSNSGVSLGYIRITDKAGRFASIDLRGCKSINDVLKKINDPVNGIYVEARINADGNGLEIIDQNNGAAGKLEVIDIDSTSAADLGIAGKTVDLKIVGKDVDPALTLSTQLSALANDVFPGKIYVQSGDYSGEIDLTGVKTIGELVDKLSNTDSNFNLQAWISEDGKRINLTNTAGQPYIKVRDASGEKSNAASALGLGNTPSVFTTLIDLRDNLLRGDSKAISEESLAQLDQDLDRILNLHAEVGAKSNRATATREKQENITLNLKKMLSSVEDIDMAEAIIKMTELETAYQAALQVGSQIMQMSLLDFLR